jgi:hypothetical protein
VRDTGKGTGKEPLSDVCPHPADLCYGGICVGCEQIVDMPETRVRKVPTETVARYAAIISKAKERKPKRR